MSPVRLPAILPAIMLATFCALVLAPGPACADQSALTRAATLYEQRDYAAAYKQYLKLAKAGDTFSQYRASYMNLMGLGTGANAVDALAWAVLAAQGDHENLDRYESTVAAMVPGGQRVKAEKRADYFLRRWGREDRGGGGRVLASTSEGGCTGSRLAANCGQGDLGGGSKWIAWGTDKSRDPEHRRQIEELNRDIVERAAELGARATG